VHDLNVCILIQCRLKFAVIQQGVAQLPSSCSLGSKLEVILPCLPPSPPNCQRSNRFSIQRPSGTCAA
jgi:hypothetical protein